MNQQEDWVKRLMDNKESNVEKKARRDYLRCSIFAGIGCPISAERMAMIPAVCEVPPLQSISVNKNDGVVIELATGEWFHFTPEELQAVQVNPTQTAWGILTTPLYQLQYG